MEPRKHIRRESSESLQCPSVYFICHPDDFKETFDQVSKDILKICDCSIFYREDGGAEDFREEPDQALGKMTMYVIAVTSRLLSEKKRAVDEAVAFAQKKYIPVLPILMEAGISEAYSGDETFRDLPCIDLYGPYDSDLSYENKLERYLSVFLLNLTYADLTYGKSDMEPQRRIMAAADMGNYESMVSCVFMYRDGIGVLKNLREAVRWCEKCVGYSLKKYGEEHSATLRDMKDLIRLYDQTGDYEKGIELGEKACEISSRALGEEDPSTVRFMKMLFFFYGETGRYEKGIQMGEQVCEILCRTAGDEAPSSMTLQKMLSILYDKAGSYEKAVKLGEKVYGIDCRLFGEEDARTLDSLSRLAAYHSDLGSYEKALELVEKKYQIESRTLGKKHLSTLRTLAVMADVYDRQGNHEKVVEICDRIAETGIELTAGAKR